MNRTEFYSFAKQDATFSSYDSNRKKLADEVMRHAFDWHVSNPKAGINKKGLKAARKSCKMYIRQNFRPDPTAYGFSGSLILGWIFYLVLNAIINWVIRRLLDDWLFKK